MIDEMADLIPDGSPQDSLGKLSVPATLLMAVWNMVSTEDVELWILLVTGLLGIIYLIYKIVKIRIDIKNANLDRAIKEKKLQDDSGTSK